jgi:hypothetical protein
MRAFFPMLVPLLVSAVTLSCTSDPTTAVGVPMPVASLSVEPTNVVIPVGASTQLSAIARDSSGGTLSGRVTTWTSSNNSIAVVGTAGVVNGVAPGSAEIIATAEGKSARAGITVGSVPLMVDAGPDQTISLGTAAAFNAKVTSTSPDPVRMFWTKMSGPGKVSIATEQFNSVFDDPTFTDWIGGNQVEVSKDTLYPASNPQPRRGLQGVAGNWISTYWATTTQAMQRNGAGWTWQAKTPFSWEHSAKLLKWNFDRTESYYACWFYWPGDMIVNGRGTGGFFDYLNLMQWKERTQPWNPTWVIGVEGKLGSPTLDEFIIQDWYNRQPIVRTGVVVPKDQWVHLAAYMKEGFGTAGELTVWLNHTLIFRQTGINTLGGTTNTNPAHLMWGISNYSDALVGQGGQTIYYTDVTVNPVNAGDILKTTATFSKPGTYVLRLTASAGTLTGKDDMTITVR